MGRGYLNRSFFGGSSKSEKNLIRQDKSLQSGVEEAIESVLAVLPSFLRRRTFVCGGLSACGLSAVECGRPFLQEGKE
jgi:hypothetical protein